MTTEYNLIEGAAVVTSDGDKLGEVKETHAGAFKVAAAMQPDYWLDTTCISSVIGNEVLVSFTKDRLGDYKLDNPPMG